MTSPFVRTLGILATTVVLAALTACAGAVGVEADPEPAPTETTPTPARIAALSYETAAVVAALGLEENLVIVPEAMRNPILTDHSSAFADIAAVIPVVSETDPEAVIATSPDIALLTARHGLEDGVADALKTAGIETLVLHNPWATPEDVIADVRTIGEALGAAADAERLAQDLAAGLVAAEAPSVPVRVLVLSNQAGRPFVTAGAAFPLALVELAGGSDVSGELGLRTSGPITAEQVVQLDPDAILLVDMNGSGEKLFAPLLDSPAVATLDALANDRVHVVPGRSVQALGLLSTVDGLADLTGWIAEVAATL